MAEQRGADAGALVLRRDVEAVELVAVQDREPHDPAFALEHEHLVGLDPAAEVLELVAGIMQHR